jgi:hypothetical protein
MTEGKEEIQGQPPPLSIEGGVRQPLPATAPRICLAFHPRPERRKTWPRETSQASAMGPPWDECERFPCGQPDAFLGNSALPLQLYFGMSMEIVVRSMPLAARSTADALGFGRGAGHSKISCQN